MKQTTLCFFVKDNHILLALKKRGFGAGKWNGYGGKVEADESPAKAVVREIKEESGLTVNDNDLEQVGLIRFYFNNSPLWECFIFLIQKWQGEPQETEEMKPQWYSMSHIPFQEMWAADVQWIPLILRGEKIEGEIVFNEDGSEVKSFNYKNLI